MDMKGYVMTFQEFANRLGGVIRAESSTHAFCRTLFEAIIPDDKVEVLDEYSKSAYKAYFNGNSNITRIAKKIYMDTQADIFAGFINGYEDTTVQKICDAFSDILPDINCHNAGVILGELFESIIGKAAANKKSAPKDAEENINGPLAIITDKAKVAPDLADFKDGVLYIEGVPQGDEDIDPFERFIENAVEYYSAKKTLLYAEQPRPFYDLYVCNDLRYHKKRITGWRDPKPEITINDGTVEALERESKYIIIQGTGGIGKSMFLTHLFLSSAYEYGQTGRLPILVSLKEYRESTLSVVDLVWSAVKEYDASVSQKNILAMLEEKRLILLLDGLDEIQSALRDSFNKDLEAFIKSYSGNSVFITSRPVYAFVSYTKFSLFDIEPLDKSQAIALINKIDFWDEKGKAEFLIALDRKLYCSHYQFASNPLLLTIMLMTFSSFGEVPAKMHVFYSKAYETMARLHDATKGAYQRPLHTGLTPEEFAKYFAQFCARTYSEEVLEFTEMTFSAYMNKVINCIPRNSGITAKDFLLDLTNNLCIMYYEGGKYYFIHRSFQEYFAAVHFASDYDEKLKTVGDFFEKQQHRFYSDRTFDMLYDMIPEKVERYIFLPYLSQLFDECQATGKDEEYWEFLERQYPYLCYERGEVGESYSNEPDSFIYKFLIKAKKLDLYGDLDTVVWPSQIEELPTRKWVFAYRKFLDSEAFEKFLTPEDIPDDMLFFSNIVDEDELPYQYTDFFGDPDPAGSSIDIDIYKFREDPEHFRSIRDFMEADRFPLIKEYRRVKDYYNKLKEKTAREMASKALFDD